MINDSVIKDYAEDYIINSGQSLGDWDMDGVVSDLHHLAFVNGLTVDGYDDCDAFPVDGFVDAFSDNAR